MRDFIDSAMIKLREMDVIELSAFKVCLVAFGILIGLLANRKCKKFSPIILLIFIVSYIFVIYKFILEDNLSL